MNLKHTALSLSFLLLAACSASSTDGDGDAARGPIAKADNLGSCETTCDGKAPGGTCYCDATCMQYGDCCSDRAMFCGGGGTVTGDAGVPAFGTDDSRSFVVIADRQAGLATPRDLEFNPADPTQLWTVNRKTDAVVIVKKVGTAEQTFDVRDDAFGNHFMEEVAAFAFGDNDAFASIHESRNTYDNVGFPNDFMGPALWPANLSILARVNQNPNGELLGSHLDMLHQSPLSMGIAHHAGNAYWVFDGMYGHIVYYDFQKDHGPGYHDHSDGIVRRYLEVEVQRVPDIPSHLVNDKATGWLYIADTGNQRVLRMDTSSGSVTRQFQPRNEPLAEFTGVTGVTVEVFASQNLVAPSGIEVHGTTLFVSDFGTGEIIAYDTTSGAELGRLATGARGIMGLAVGPDEKLYFVDGRDDLLVRIDP